MQGPSTITGADYQLLRSLHEEGVFEHVDIGEIKQDIVVAVLCADGHRFGDGYEHATCACGRNVHPLTKHGGALVLARDSPFARTHRKGVALHHDLTLLQDIENALGFKQTPHVLSFAHFPCAIANEHNLSVLDVLILHVQAKERLREEIPHCDARCLVHIDYLGHRTKRRFASYFLNRQKFFAWMQRHHPERLPELYGELAA